jgi:hypothetical protein
VGGPSSVAGAISSLMRQCLPLAACTHYSCQLNQHTACCGPPHPAPELQPCFPACLLAPMLMLITAHTLLPPALTAPACRRQEAELEEGKKLRERIDSVSRHCLGVVAARMHAPVRYVRLLVLCLPRSGWADLSHSCTTAACMPVTACLSLLAACLVAPDPVHLLPVFDPVGLCWCECNLCPPNPTPTCSWAKVVPGRACPTPWVTSPRLSRMLRAISQMSHLGWVQHYWPYLH